MRKEQNMSKTMVADFVVNSSQYVHENDDLLKVVQCMKKFSIDTISVVNEKFSLVNQLKKQDIKNYFKTKYFLFGNIIHSLKHIQVKDVIKKNTMPLIFYPETKAEDAFYMMKYLKNNCALVVETPMDKKVIGFICLKDTGEYYE